MPTPGVPVRPTEAGGPNRNHRAVVGTIRFNHVADQGRRAHHVTDDSFHQVTFQVGFAPSKPTVFHPHHFAAAEPFACTTDHNLKHRRRKERVQRDASSALHPS